jgi:hypothetical protein
MGIKEVARGDSAKKEAALGDSANVGVVASRAVASKPTKAAVTGNFMSLQGEAETLLSVIRTNRLQVKEKGVMVCPRMTLFSSALRHRGTKSSYWWWSARAEGAIR